MEVLAPNWYALSPADASIRGGRPNARVMGLSRRLGFAVWPVVNATMKGAPLLDTPAGRTRIVTQITALAARYRLAGVTLDMEEMLPRQRAAYSTLVAQLSGALHAAHRKLAVYAVRRTATDVDDGAAAYDWAALARSADLVLASGYNEHSAVTSPGPVTTGAGFAAVAQYAAATSKGKIAPAMGAFGYAVGGRRRADGLERRRRAPLAGGRRAGQRRRPSRDGRRGADVVRVGRGPVGPRARRRAGRRALDRAVHARPRARPLLERSRRALTYAVTRSTKSATCPRTSSLLVSLKTSWRAPS